MSLLSKYTELLSRRVDPCFVFGLGKELDYRWRMIATGKHEKVSDDELKRFEGLSDLERCKASVPILNKKFSSVNLIHM